MPVEARAAYLTPMLHVASIEESIRFYELLGFETVDTDWCEPLGWARLHCEGRTLMFLRAEAEVDTRSVPVLFYMYTPDLSALRERLIQNGLEVPPIKYPEYMPSGEFYLSDPDGYRLGIAHWGKTEHEAWLRRISPVTRKLDNTRS